MASLYGINIGANLFKYAIKLFQSTQMNWLEVYNHPLLNIPILNPIT